MLVKLMGMTGSEHDGEALAALRKATALLVRNKTTWAEIFGQVAQAPPRPPGSSFRDAQQRWRHETTPGGGGGDVFRDAWERAHRSGRDEAEAKSAQKMWEEALRAAGIDPETLRAGNDERAAVARARLRLDVVLQREKLDARKREHFEAIRKQHQHNGYINPAHRAQIDRAYYSQGWDGPLGNVDEDKRF